MKRTFAVLWMAGMMGTMTAWAQMRAAQNPMITEGTQVFEFGGRIDDDGHNFGANFSGRAGMFVKDYIEAGIMARLGFRGSDTKRFAIGGYGEYHFDLNTHLVPFAGLAASLNYLDSSRRDSTFLELEGSGGIRYFFVDHGAVGTRLSLKLATDDVYRKGDHFDFALIFFTSWYFNR